MLLRQRYYFTDRKTIMNQEKELHQWTSYTSVRLMTW